MRLDVDEREFEDLEIRLRRSAAGHRPAVPDELMRFIDTVPDSYHRRSRLATAIALPRLRAGFAVAATAAALIVAIVAGMALVSVRNGQPGASIDPEAPVTGSGWTWQRADGSVLGGIDIVGGLGSALQPAFQVANGYVGLCGAGGDNETLCTSSDGLRWTSPADPKIVVVAGGGQFLPNDIVRSGSVLVALGQGERSDMSGLLWRSTDGLHWSEDDSPTLYGFSGQTIGVLAGGFAMIGNMSGDIGGWPRWVMTSADGLDWVRSSQLPVKPRTFGVGPMRLFVGGSAGATTEVWQSLDGTEWTRVDMPAGITPVREYTLSGGGFVGSGWVGTSQGDANTLANTFLASHLLRSADGVSWQIDDDGIPGEAGNLVAAGGRLFANVSVPYTATATPTYAPYSPEWMAQMYAIWQSSDEGRSWQPVADGTGRQMSGLLSEMGGRLTVSTWNADAPGWGLAWVGTPSSPPAS
jgi:hypothetical protein